MFKLGVFYTYSSSPAFGGNRIKTKAKREAILNYVELNPGCCEKEMTKFFDSELKTIDGHLRELKKENRIGFDDSLQSHIYHSLADDNDTIDRFGTANLFFSKKKGDKKLKEYLDVMKNILKSRPSLSYYAMHHYKAFADKQEKLTDNKLIDMPYSKEESQQDIIIKNWQKSLNILTKIPEEINPEYKESWEKIITEALPILNAKPATIVPFTQAAKAFQKGNEKPMLDLRDEWLKMEFNRGQEIVLLCGKFQYFIRKYRGQGEDVSRFEEIFNQQLGFFIYSPEYLHRFILKVHDYFEKNIDKDLFFLELGSESSNVKVKIDIGVQEKAKKEKAKKKKILLFRKYKIYCIKHCFMTQNKLWEVFFKENKKALKQIDLKKESHENFVRDFNRWNKLIDYEELIEKVQILNMEGNFKF